MFDPKEIEMLAGMALYAYLAAIPDLEKIEEEELWVWILQRNASDNSKL